ncbi:uncharacterized protein BDZ99DRAFT_517254 [Mytilinidion resinicola]|uniref:Uncharacterized protein n=1 Tax=Mytilinidion resinicola TaxID=574789 RepID=A0A6A6YWM4_9PEZI|nr:uncharacterized protein BDZ99DRAFT_517254 [Mytilinidion resinicola]KAF2812958.1 hypothetical protein BDZ99DRAFT_517254 [Mytilinidion resinicola]
MSRILFVYTLTVGIFGNLAHCKPNPPGVICIIIQPDHADKHAFGLDLIYSDVAPSQLAHQFHGFPVLQGDVTHPIPSNPTSGYASLFGWIQFVKQVSKDGDDGNWTMDLYPYAQDINTPFGYWGVNPSVFDAPAIALVVNGKNEAVVWTAQAFLCVLDDAGFSKNVSAIPGTGLTWGFDIDVDHKTLQKGRFSSGGLKQFPWNQNGLRDFLCCGSRFQSGRSMMSCGNELAIGDSLLSPVTTSGVNSNA